MVCVSMGCQKSADGVCSFFPGTDTDAVIQGGDEDFSVTDFARAGTLDDGVDCCVDVLIVDRDLDTNLVQKLNFDFRTAVVFREALLLSAAFGG